MLHAALILIRKQTLYFQFSSPCLILNFFGEPNHIPTSPVFFGHTQLAGQSPHAAARNPLGKDGLCLFQGLGVWEVGEIS